MQVMRTWTCCHAILRRFTVLVLEFPASQSLVGVRLGFGPPGTLTGFSRSGPLDKLSWIITNHHVYLVRICANTTWMVCRMPPCTMVLQPLNPKASRLGGLVALLACVPRKSTTARAGRVVTRAATEDEGLQRVFQSVMSHGGSENDGGGWRTWRNLTEYLGG